MFGLMENTKKLDLYVLFPHLEFYLSDRSNVISINALNTFTIDTMEKSKLGEVGFGMHDIFSSPALEEKICSDNPRDVLNPPTESIPFKIPMRIIEKVMDERYAGDETVHPSDHLLKLKELCECLSVQVYQEKMT